MIRYYKLFDLINRKGMKKTDLLSIMSSPTLAKLSKGDIVKTDIIDKICLFLRCQPGDIMECFAKIDIETKESQIEMWENYAKATGYVLSEEDRNKIKDKKNGLKLYADENLEYDIVDINDDLKDN